MIYNENCLETLKRKDFNANYCFTTPPDYSEVNIKPEDPEYLELLYSVFDKLIEKINIITISLTDRKYDCRIIPKHFFIINYFLNKKWNLISHKIWHKSNKINLFRLNYSNILTFSSKRKIKQYHPKEYEYDVFLESVEKYQGFNHGFPLKITEFYIKNFTKEGEIVYDCFMGSGTTALAAKNLNRKYIGSEISQDTYELCLNRLIKDI